MSKEEDVYLITAEGCPYCDALKNWLSKKGVSFKELDVTKDELGTKIAVALNTYEVPLIVKKSTVGGGKKICLLDKEMQPEKCIEAEEVWKVESKSSTEQD